MLVTTLLMSVLTGLGAAQSTFSPLRPPAIPLAVRSPYLSTWQQAGSDGGNGGYLYGQWPTFWHGAITGWTGMIRVDNTTYTWLGKPDVNEVYVNQTAFTYTSTRSTFVFNVGEQVNLTAEFLSPVAPNDLERASLPYTYLNVAVESIDGKQHDVQLYTDVSAEWAAGDRNAIAQWSYGSTAYTNTAVDVSNAGTALSDINSRSQATTLMAALKDFARRIAKLGGLPLVDQRVVQNQERSMLNNRNVERDSTSTVSYHRFWRQQQLEFAEFNEQAEWGYWYYATKDASGVSYQSGADEVVRKNFLSTGVLPDTQDTNYRAINDAFPVFAYAVDLGKVGSASTSTLFQLSLHQKNCVQFQDKKNSVSSIPCMWNEYFSTEEAAVSYFYNDFSNGSALADSIDNKIATDSKAAGGQDYLSLTSLATRQAFGALEFTNTPSQPYIFMKEISSDGNVNTVDVIYPFHPIALYTNPEILKWLMDPIYINTEAGNWPKQYTIHDIGSAFPNATGHSDGNAEDQPLEECGNMLIMTLAYAQRANDTAYLSQHYDLLKQWTGFLVQEALIPQNQISTDDFAGSAANQTNLALKGIIGIEAMARIANLTGHTDDGKNYSAIAQDYISKWQVYGTNTAADPPHTEFNYNNASSYSLLYNLYGDRELGLGLVPQSVYTMQSNFYPTKMNKYGVPLDTRHTYTKNDWEIFCAAIASSSTRDLFTANIAQWLDNTPTNFAFTDLYDTITGGYPANGPVFVARPVVGGMFAFLALDDTSS